MGVFALVIGCILVLCAAGTSTTVDGTHNIGLLQNQMMLLHAGLAMLIISAVRWDKGAGLTKSRVASSPFDGPEPTQRVQYERPTGFDTQQKIIAAIVFVLIMGIAFLAIKG